MGKGAIAYFNRFVCILKTCICSANFGLKTVEVSKATDGKEDIISHNYTHIYKKVTDTSLN